MDDDIVVFFRVSDGTLAVLGASKGIFEIDNVSRAKELDIGVFGKNFEDVALFVSVRHPSDETAVVEVFVVMGLGRGRSSCVCPNEKQDGDEITHNSIMPCLGTVWGFLTILPPFFLSWELSAVSIPSMQFFLDTGEVEEIRQSMGWGIVDGVTTNPSLIAKSGRRREEVIAEICALGVGPVSAEVIATEHAAMMGEAEALADIHPNVVVKLPLTGEGIRTCSLLSKKGIRTNVTLCFSANQALLAAKAGATYISPFVGRLDDIGHSGIELVEEIRDMYDQYGFETQILAASLRHAGHVQEAAAVGADVGTMPLKVMSSLFAHPLTDKGLEIFLADHLKAAKGLPGN